MKQHSKWFTTALAVTGGLLMAHSVQSQTYTLSNFQNFNLSATYANWNDPGWTTFGGGAGIMAPVITSGATPGSFEINAGGYGSGAYDFATPINAAGANQFVFTFTINTATAPVWMNPGIDISDGTHMVHLTAANADGGFLSYGNYGTGTYTLYGPLHDQFGGADLDVSTITAFNLEFDPAGNIAGNVYDITYNSLVLTTVPEPTTMALLGIGTAALLIIRRRARVS